MIMAILIILLITFVVMCSGIVYIVGKIKYIHIQLEDTIDLSKAKIINAISRILKRNMDMEVPDVEVMDDKLIMSIEAEKINARKKGVRGKN